ncbi:MAG: acyl-CoA dehydrogenase family protein [Cyanobacteria bacterium REEB67]|nr:acyl-CoA dehydrogenase family protein [Cyanobacteria bacterium REEB67]
MTQTHTVFNQASELVDYDMYLSDPVLNDLIHRHGAAWAAAQLSAYGRFAGSTEGIELARQANDNPPVLHTHDRFGNRIDEVKFHPAYHRLMQAAIDAGIHSMPWATPRPGAHVARAALMYMAFQNEAGHCCPISMTYSVIPALRRQPDLAAQWEKLICSTVYDGSFRPAAAKSGLTVGMGMTEKQGGSDVRANTTRAVPAPTLAAAGTAPGIKPYLLTGHKWFTSAPMSDAFLILAQTEKGVTCFFVPRWRPDGSLNTLRIQRLKDKMGNKSNASSELEFEEALGYIVGDEGRGVATIIEMVNHTRLDCMIGAAALMRQATRQAAHHASGRAAFGKLLIDQPLMASVLADLSLESEAAIRMTMRVAEAYDKSVATADGASNNNSAEAQFKRIASAVSKYWICKRAPMHVAEALECLGGNGYVESGPMPRLFRESPLLGIWEGSGNVICLDVLRAVAKEPETLDAFMAEVEKACGVNRSFDAYVRKLKRYVADLKVKATTADIALSREQGARRLVEQLALALQASLMLQQAHKDVANAFVSSRLGNEGGFAFGSLPSSVKPKTIKTLVDRSR